MRETETESERRKETCWRMMRCGSVWERLAWVGGKSDQNTLHKILKELIKCYSTLRRITIE